MSISLARTPWSWVRIPHKAWMFGICMCLFCVCVSCVYMFFLCLCCPVFMCLFCVCVVLCLCVYSVCVALCLCVYSVFVLPCVYVFILCLCCPVFMCLFCVSVSLCSGRDLATSRSLVQGVLPSVKWSWNWKKYETRAQDGCRASERNVNFVL
jgi:hypothetical protein